MRRKFPSHPLFILAGFLFFGQSVNAQKSASVLPNGIWRVRWVGVRTASLTQSLNDDGTASNTMSALEKSLTAKDLAALNSDLAQLYNGLNAYEEGLGDSLILADFYPDSSMVATKNTIAAEYGLSSKVSLGIIIPITTMRVDASFSADVQNNVAAIQAKVQGNSALENGLNTFSSSMPTSESFAQSVFTDNGYVVPGSFGWTGMGDIELGAKIQALKFSKFRATTLLGFRAPTTTHKANIRNLLDSNSGDNQWDLAFELATEYLPTKDFIFGVGTRYTIQLPNNQDKALLRDGQTGLPNLTVPGTIQNVRRNLGDQLETEIGASYQYNRFIVSTDYENLFKTSDSYSVPTGYRKDNLESETDALQHRYALGLKYTTLAAFVAKKASIPFEAKLTYSDIFAGRNVTKAAYARLDLIFFLK